MFKYALAIILGTATIPCGAAELPTGTVSQHVEFECDHHRLVGTLLLPPGDGPFAVAVFVHGSGPADRAAGGLYSPIFATFLRANVACLAWDKPGIGESTGDYRTQFNADRAQEVLAAIEWLKNRPEVDPRRIGLWGISQAGYIIPQVAVKMPDVRFAILVSPAHTPLLEVVKFSASTEVLRSMMVLLGHSQQQAQEADAFIQSLFTLLERHGTHAELLAMMKEGESKPWFKALHNAFGLFKAEDITPGFYDRLLHEVTEDPKSNLEMMHCPMLAIFGADDAQVDARSGKTCYESAARVAQNRDVTVQVFPAADHGIRILRDGRRVAAPGYYDLLGQWIKQHSQHEAQAEK